MVEMTQVVGVIIGWVMAIFAKGTIRFGREHQAQFEHTRFEMLVSHPTEQKNISEHLLSTQYGPGLF